jgi:two-component system LytT family response regulator
MRTNSKGQANLKGLKIMVKTAQGLQSIAVSDITHLVCNVHKTTIFLSNKSSLEVSRLLKNFEDKLAGQGFIRSRRNTIINMNFVSEIINGDERKVRLNDGTLLDISHRRFSLVRAYFLEHIHKRDYLYI